MDKPRIITWILIVAGVLALGYGVYQLQAARQSTSWSVTEGKIERVDIEVATTTRKRSSSNRPDARRKKTRYDVTLENSYTVDGQTHRASRYAFGRGSRVSKKYRTREAAREVAHAYAPADPISVYYDPSDPTEAVIKQASPARSGFLLCLDSSSWG